MLKNILSLDWVSLLSKEQQKNIGGGIADPDGSRGGNCAARQWRNYAPPLNGQYFVVAYELTQQQAVAFANGGAGGGNVACTKAGYANSPWA